MIGRFIDWHQILIENGGVIILFGGLFGVIGGSIAKQKDPESIGAQFMGAALTGCIPLVLYIILGFLALLYLGLLMVTEIENEVV